MNKPVKTTPLSPTLMYIAAFGLIGPLGLIALFGAPSGPGLLANPWLIWCAAIFNAACGIFLIAFARRQKSQAS